MFSRGAAVLRGAVRSRKQPAQGASVTAGHSAPHTAHLHTLFKPPASTFHHSTTVVTRILTQFISSAIARGTSRAAFRTFTRAVLQGSGAQFPTSVRSITQSLSLSSRSAVSPTLLRPHAFVRAYIPKAPSTYAGGFARGPRAVANVGLGTARNFSSGAGRPLFQNLVHNVPVTLRAICEIDLDTKLKEHKGKVLVGRNSTKKENKFVGVKSRDSLSFGSSYSASVDEEEFARFFTSSSGATVKPAEPYITTLSIPLSPALPEEVSGQQRHPLPSYESINDIQINPWDANNAYLPQHDTLSGVVQGVHLAYNAHSLRVTRLFAKLDEADVWSRGASCSALSEHSRFGADLGGVLDGPVRVLDVRFEGWTKEMVLELLGGDLVLDWCEIRESAHRTSEPELLEVEHPEEMWYSAPSLASEEEHESMSFIMPTLDFSVPSLSREAPTRFESQYPATSPNDEHNEWAPDWDYNLSFASSPLLLTPNLSTPTSEFDLDLASEIDEELDLPEHELAFSDSPSDSEEYQESWHPARPMSTTHSISLESIEDIEDADARSEWSSVLERGSGMNAPISLEGASLRSLGERIMF